jgi:hypothetical protein
MINTSGIKDAITEHEALRKDLKLAEDTLKTVQCRFGQGMTHVFVGGCRFDFLTMDRESGYAPYVMKGCEELQQAAEKIMQNRVKMLRGRIEGVEFKIKQLSKG